MNQEERGARCAALYRRLASVFFSVADSSIRFSRPELVLHRCQFTVLLPLATRAQAARLLQPLFSKNTKRETRRRRQAKITAVRTTKDSEYDITCNICSSAGSPPSRNEPCNVCASSTHTARSFREICLSKSLMTMAVPGRRRGQH